MRHFDAEKLVPLMESELVARNVDPDSIRHVVASLIQTSLRGVDSHGINIFPHYCRAVAAGRVNDRPHIVVTRTGLSTALVDADHAFGHHAGAVAMEEAVTLALESGMGAVSVRNSTHFGAAAYFGLMAPERNCLGFAFTNADALVKAFSAREAFFGTNPICFTAPMATEGPFCLDMATSLVSWNKINNYRREDKQIPDDWAFDSHGSGVTNPHAARSLNPAGGYKGFGLGMMVDILCAVLAEGLISKDVKAMYDLPLDNSKRNISHFFMALDISRFCRVDVFQKAVQSMANRVRSVSPLEEENEIMVAGDPEKINYNLRVIEGVPVDDAKFTEFIELNQNFESVVMT
jgi:ureidoglycolate dehydrogenase (NAD+)